MAKSRIDVFAETMAESTPLTVEQIRRVVNLHLIGYSTIEIGRKTGIEAHMIRRLTWVWEDANRQEEEDEESDPDDGYEA